MAYNCSSQGSILGISVSKMDPYILILMEQIAGHSAASREEYSVLDSVEPDPIGFHEQVGSECVKPNVYVIIPV